MHFLAIVGKNARDRAAFNGVPVPSHCDTGLMPARHPQKVDRPSLRRTWPLEPHTDRALSERIASSPTSDIRMAQTFASVPCLPPRSRWVRLGICRSAWRPASVNLLPPRKYFAGRTDSRTRWTILPRILAEVEFIVAGPFRIPPGSGCRRAFRAQPAFA